MEQINWTLIAKLPADDLAHEGGPEYGAFKVSHKAATRQNVELLLAETGRGLYRRRMIPRAGKPMTLANAEFISGRL